MGTGKHPRGGTSLSPPRPEGCAQRSVSPAATPENVFTHVTATNLPESADLHSLDAEFGDFDTDGDLDIAIALENGPNRLYRNDGTGKFADRERECSPGTARPFGRMVPGYMAYS